MKKEKVILYNRQINSLQEEQVFHRWFMDFFYGHPVGIFLSELIIKRIWYSKIYTLKRRTSASVAQIQAFVKRYNVDVSEVEQDISSFPTFNDFFKRKLKSSARPIVFDSNVLISPADSRLLVFPICKDTVFPVKAKPFTPAQLFKNNELAAQAQYEDGLCFVFRLAPVDYHRFCFIDDGRQSPVQTIKGHLRSVNPLALRCMFPIFQENYREYAILSTKNFDEVIQVDVGALSVGKICQNLSKGGLFKKGQEKGYFELGGSTIVMFFKKGIVEPDKDIVSYSKQNIETIVRMGEQIGIKNDR
jgi:phosphatidylserine decarboxylase